MSSQSNPSDRYGGGANSVAVKRGMILPFTPLAMSFDSMNYYVSMPAVRIILFLSPIFILYGLLFVFSLLSFLDKAINEVTPIAICKFVMATGNEGSRSLREQASTAS